MKEIDSNLETYTGDTLFYDGQCGVCRAEIERLERHRTQELRCIDIHANIEIPKRKEELLSQLHLRRADGTWLVGLEANVAAWQYTKWGALATVLLWPGLRWFAELAYRVWLIWYRHQRAKRLKAPGQING